MPSPWFCLELRHLASWLSVLAMIRNQHAAQMSNVQVESVPKISTKLGEEPRGLAAGSRHRRRPPPTDFVRVLCES